jgi:hypothetical protein
MSTSDGTSLLQREPDDSAISSAMNGTCVPELATDRFSSATMRAMLVDSLFIIFKRRAGNVMSRATMAMFVTLSIALALAGPALGAPPEMTRLTPDQQIALTLEKWADKEIEVDREFLAQFAKNLKTFADFGKILYKYRDLKMSPGRPTATSRAFFDRIRPTQKWLSQGASKTEQLVPDKYRLLPHAYDLVKSIEKDLTRDEFRSARAVVSSNTVQAAVGFGASLIYSEDFLKEYFRENRHSPFRVKLPGFLTFGAEELSKGIYGEISKGQFGNPEDVEHLLDGLNRAAWAAVGYLASGGNMKAASLIADMGGFIATNVRERSLQFWVDRFMENYKIDQAILDTYENAQRARIAHNQPAQSFEEFVGNDDSETFKFIKPEQIRAANARFGLPSPDRTTTSFSSTLTTKEHYREACDQSGCTHTDLATRPPAKEGGVRINPQPQLVGQPDGDFAARLIRSCQGAASPACAVR